MKSFLFTLPLITLVTSASTAQPVLQATTAPAAEFHQTPDGNWHTTIHGKDGAETDFVYVPRTKLSPKVTTTFRLLNPAEPRFLYTYTVANEPMSAQPIELVNIGPDVPGGLEISRALEEWYAFSTPGYVAVMVAQDSHRGIAPGGSSVVEFEAVNLPGVVSVMISGDVTPLTVPDELSQRQYNELQKIAGSVGLKTFAIGPVINVDFESAETTLAVRLARVGNNYLPALELAKHPYAKEISELFGGGLQAGNDGALRAAIAQIRSSASKPVIDPWHRSMSDALKACMDVLLAR